MPDRFAGLPSSLRSRSESTTLAGVPALVVMPESDGPSPLVFWMHGRTVSKELDPGRYLRLMRAGIGVCAIDLPGHGERADADMMSPARSPEVIARVQPEINAVLAELLDTEGPYAGRFDPGRLGIGGMSLGGMATLRRLCEPHRFAAAAVESTTGDLKRLYAGVDFAKGGWPVTHEPETVAAVDPAHHLEGFAPLPLLALHSEADAVVPWAGQAAFLDALARRYRQAGADPALIERTTWPETGAPDEHSGFGRVAADAKNLLTAFFVRTLGA